MKAINVTTLLADEGHVLTQAADVEAEERFYTTEIILGCNDSVENYKEVPVEEARKKTVEQTEKQKTTEEHKEEEEHKASVQEVEAPAVEGPLTEEQAVEEAPEDVE